jgi:hypothetical protein
MRRADSERRVLNIYIYAAQLGLADLGLQLSAI